MSIIYGANSSHIHKTRNTPKAPRKVAIVQPVTVPEIAAAPEPTPSDPPIEESKLEDENRLTWKARREKKKHEPLQKQGTELDSSSVE